MKIPNHSPLHKRESAQEFDLVQLNEYETNPYFLQIFQSNTTVCLIIYVFCKSCKHGCEPEIVQKIKTKKTQESKGYVLQNWIKDFVFWKDLCYITLEKLQMSKQNNFTFANLTKRVNQHCPALEILKIDCKRINLLMQNFKF